MQIHKFSTLLHFKEVFIETWGEDPNIILSIIFNTENDVWFFFIWYYGSLVKNDSMIRNI